MGHAANDLCNCGDRETTEHLLLSCNEKGLPEARAKLRDGVNKVPLSLQLLLNTKIGIEKTLEFLRSTRICTRKWHLERRQEDLEPEEEEEEDQGQQDDLWEEIFGNEQRDELESAGDDLWEEIFGDDQEGEQEGAEEDPWEDLFRGIDLGGEVQGGEG